MTQWLSRIEGRCTPVLAWTAAVTAVVTLAPAAYLWHLLSGGDSAGRSRRARSITKTTLQDTWRAGPSPPPRSVAAATGSAWVIKLLGRSS